MSGLNHARDLLQMAQADLKALEGMLKLDADLVDPFFSDEIFGFHAQQAVEKILKARIASLGGSYSKTHNLMSLIDTLDELGQDVSDLSDFVDLNSFAVQYRYESSELEDEELDRKALLATTTHLFAQMRSRIEDKFY